MLHLGIASSFKTVTNSLASFFFRSAGDDTESDAIISYDYEIP
jgi:hypothetical protein